MTNLQLRFSYAQQDLERQGKLDEDEVGMICISLSNTNLSAQSKVNAIEGLLKVQQFWSRKCDESGEGFDDGWLMGDFIYLKYEKDVDEKLIDWAINEGYKSWSLERVKEHYHELGSYYYSEWDFYDEILEGSFYLELSTGDVVSWDEYLDSHIVE